VDKITVKQILTGWLKKHGYDGLCGDECGCGLDDLIPCDGNPADCVPGYKVPCPPEYVEDFGEFIYWPKKEPPTAEELDDAS